MYAFWFNNEAIIVNLDVSVRVYCVYECTNIFVWRRRVHSSINMKIIEIGRGMESERGRGEGGLQIDDQESMGKKGRLIRSCL